MLETLFFFSASGLCLLENKATYHGQRRLQQRRTVISADNVTLIVLSPLSQGNAVLIVSRSFSCSDFGIAINSWPGIRVQLDKEFRRISCDEASGFSAN